MIWKLTPTDLPSEHWECSTYKGEAIVRAASADEARTIAGQAFLKATPSRPGRDTPIPPWKQMNPELVSCKRLDDSDYDGWGPAEVLFPKDY